MSNRRFLTSILLLLLTCPIVAAAGGRLCFTRGDYVFLQEPNGRIKRLVKGYEPSISSDGQTIAFVSIKGENLNLDSHVKLINLGTGRVRGIPTLDPFQSLSVVWSPDGRYLAVDALDASGTSGLVIDNLSVTQLFAAASTQTLGSFALWRIITDGSGTIDLSWR
jgi:Tol biopolymer transport system component